MQSWNAAFFLFFSWLFVGGGGISGRVRALNLTVPLGSGRVGSDNLGYGPGSGFSFEPVQTSSLHTCSNLLSVFCKTHNMINSSIKKMNWNSTHLSMCEHTVAQLRTHRSEYQGDMNKSTSDYVFWKTNPGCGRQRGIEGEKKNGGDEVKRNLFLMKYKALQLNMLFCMNWPWKKMAYRLVYKVSMLLTRTI